MESARKLEEWNLAKPLSPRPLQETGQQWPQSLCSYKPRQQTMQQLSQWLHQKAPLWLILSQ